MGSIVDAECETCLTYTRTSHESFSTVPVITNIEFTMDYQCAVMKLQAIQLLHKKLLPQKFIL